MEQDRNNDKKLRNFGLVMAIGCGILGGIFLLKGFYAWRYLFAAGGFFLISGLIFPLILMPIEWIWMKVAHVLGIFMTYVLLTITYYILVTPLGLIMRLFGNDPMKRRFKRDEESYWVEVDPEGPTSRYDKPY
ncbi:MAG: hypothetical protein GWN00_38340 [Aliifodinibius sp.]|nr:hypothetical protein [Fodinibius sp.]NIV16480.1 hypothetical protein [Fodinibius sp.]NIY30435.1 hypothetical protein [Fodinibius sp.]